MSAQSIDFSAVASAALSRARELVPAWLPGGKIRGHEYVCGNLSGQPGESLSVNLQTGRWADFAGNDKGGDLVSLYAAIHRCSQLDAAKALGGYTNGYHVDSGPAISHEDGPHQQRPPHSDFTASLFRHSRHGTPTAFWVYRDAEGPLHAVARYDVEGQRKQIVPWLWDGDRWIAKAPSRPRPLYGLDQLAARPDAKILLTEGEKCADAAQRFWPSRVCMTWMGGVAGAKYADLTPLAGRAVTLWPDNDAPGRKVMAEIAEVLLKAGCQVKIIDPSGLSPDEGYDLADAEYEGRTAKELTAYANAHIVGVEVAESPRIEPQAVLKPAQVLREEPPPPDSAPDDDLNPAIFADTDIANGRRFVRQHGESVRYSVSSGWMIWDGKRWAHDQGDIAVSALAKQTALSQVSRKSHSAAAVRNMLHMAQSEPGVAVPPDALDADAWAFNCLSGTIDLRTGELRPHGRADLITKLSPVEYLPDATAPLWDAFLERVTGQSQSLVDYLQAVTGYLLTGRTSEQLLHFLYGTGANGKSVFCDILIQVLGEYACVSQPEMLMSRRAGSIPNDVARLRGVRAAFLNETSQGSRFDEAKLKDLTGGDKLNARFLHREFFDFAPTHKLIIRGNHKPAISGTDEGIWRRLRLVPFTVSIPPAEQDRDLGLKLAAELPGILAWAVKGCLNWQARGLNAPDAVLDASHEYRAESDVLQHFIDEHCQVRPGATARSGLLYKRYREFCDAGAERAVSSKDLPLEMQRRGFERKRDPGGVSYLGLSLKSEGGDAPPDWRDT